MGNHYKDSLFRSLFSDKQALLDLYNSIKETHYDEQTELIINTLPETLFTHQRNDVSFLIDGRLVIFAEHQSTTKSTKGRSFFLFEPSARSCVFFVVKFFFIPINLNGSKLPKELTAENVKFCAEF
ncbi:hypothetical protein ACYULU_04380 [Breznakiellaceae bacterium SP9]